MFRRIWTPRLVYLACVAMALCMYISSSMAASYVISPDGSGDYPTIQAALDAASNGDIIELTDGTFTGEGNRDLDYAGKAVTVRSQSGDPATCMLDGEYDYGRGFDFHSGEGAGSVLESVTLTHFLADGGGGIRCTASSPTITNCVIRSCDGVDVGGGLYCFDGASPTISHCVFANNYAYMWAAGMFLSQSSITMTHCTFTGNNGVGVEAIYVGNDGDLHLDNSIISFTGGGSVAVRCAELGTATLSCCDVYGNGAGDWVEGIAGQLGQNGNISENPRYCHAEGGDYSLHVTSPCAPDNNPTCGQVGALPVGCGTSVYVVNPEGTGDFPDIQTALANVWDGDIIELTDGTFTGEGNRDLDYAGKVVIVRSQSGDPATCILDGDYDYGRGFDFHSGEGAGSVLESVTLTHFLADGGGGIRCTASSPTITNCVIRSCDGVDVGGGLYCFDGASPTISHCVFANNYAYMWAAGMFLSQSSITMTHCTFTGNNGVGVEAIYVGNDGDLHLDNSIISFTGGGSVAVRCAELGTATLSCCDVYGNGAGDWVEGIAGQLGQNGNISEDPRYCHAEGGNYSLHVTSPCAPDNNPTCGQVGALPVGCGTSVYVVNPEGTGDFPDIQSALAYVWDQDIIELTDGTFTGEGNRQLDYGGKAVTIRSQSGDPSRCVIDGEETGDWGVRFESGEGSESVFEGITLTHFYASTGAGIRCDGSSPTITNCVISGCDGMDGGGGLACYAGASPVITNCVFAQNMSDFNGCAVLVSSSDVAISSCTFVSNLSTLSAETIYIANEATLALDHTIIAFGQATDAVINCVEASSATLSCCNVFGNTGGDWDGYIADQFGTNGNISADPLFCNAGAGNYTLQFDSPCAAENNPGCGQIGAREVGCGFRVLSVDDVPNDQGRRVRLAWGAALDDAPETDYIITEYSIWRRIDLPSPPAMDGPDEPTTATAAPVACVYPPGDWDFVKTVPAYGEATYSTVCETVCDSTLTGGICWSIFFVRAATEDPLVYFDCAPDSGYSIDNLAPAAPANLVFGSPGVLTWEEAVEPDFAYHTVYGSSSSTLDESATMLGYAVTPTYDVSGNAYGFYHVTTSDFSGNEGDEASIEGETTAVPSEELLASARLMLHMARPNPFSGETSIAFELPGTQAVRLSIYDASGRRVRVVREGRLAAGRHVAVWDGTDSFGRDVAPGMYFARIEAEGSVLSRKVLLAR